MSASPPSPPVPVQVPGMVLGQFLGQGAFASVYAGRHAALDIAVAVKLIQDSGTDPAKLEMALHEARLMARLDHPNLLRVFDVGRVQHHIFVVMEFMDGGMLAGKRLTPPGELLALARQLLSGLQALHDANILHRDIKPANALKRNRDGRVKLADLGIAVDYAAKPSDLGQLAGTFPFMAPELFESPPRFSPRSDLYALGLSLASIALSEPPYPRGNANKLLAWIREGSRPRMEERRPDLPPALAALLERMMAPRPEQRPASAGEALAALAGLDAHAPPTAASSPGSVRVTVAPVVGLPVEATVLTGGAREPGAAAAEALATGTPIGPWIVGSQVYRSANWVKFAVTHRTTGAPGRLAQLLPTGTLAGMGKLILESAARASRLNHPGFLPMLDWGQTKEGPWVVTAPQGRTLEDLVKAGGPLSEIQALQVTAALAEALAYLHAQGLVFQLIEPDTAHMARDGQTPQFAWPVYCVPKGTSVVTEQGLSQRAMSPQFSAPEEFFQMGTIEPSSDLYGLGEVLFFLLSGHPAFGNAKLNRLVMAKGQPPDLQEHAPQVTAPTARLSAQLLDPDPQNRGAGAAEICAEMRRIAQGLTG